MMFHYLDKMNMTKQTREYLFTLKPFTPAAPAADADAALMQARAAKVLETSTLSLMEQRLKDDPRCQSVTSLSLRGESWLLAECTKGLCNEFTRAFKGIITETADMGEAPRKPAPAEKPARRRSAVFDAHSFS